MAVVDKWPLWGGGWVVLLYDTCFKRANIVLKKNDYLTTKEAESVYYNVIKQDGHLRTSKERVPYISRVIQILRAQINKTCFFYV